MEKRGKPTAASSKALKDLRAFGLALPGAHLKSPWPEHMDLAVKDKTFAYLPPDGAPFGVGCKLPESSSVALMLPYVEPMGYGLGKSGWVSASPPQNAIDLEMFKAWLLESYRAQAPKSFVKQLDGGAAPAAKAPAKKPATKKPAAKKPAAKKR
jgi:predicted DNA-binding protein (MmcQ/YjbR family)